MLKGLYSETLARSNAPAEFKAHYERMHSLKTVSPLNWPDQVYFVNELNKPLLILHHHRHLAKIDACYHATGSCQSGLPGYFARLKSQDLLCNQSCIRSNSILKMAGIDSYLR